MPIDQDETFVSLSMAKNLGDNDSVAIDEKLHTLYKIQQTDTKIDRIYLLRGELLVGMRAQIVQQRPALARHIFRQGNHLL